MVVVIHAPGEMSFPKTHLNPSRRLAAAQPLYVSRSRSVDARSIRPITVVSRSLKDHCRRASCDPTRCQCLWRVESVIRDRVQPGQSRVQNPVAGHHLLWATTKTTSPRTQVRGQHSTTAYSTSIFTRNIHSQYSYSEPHRKYAISLAYENHAHPGRHCRFRAAKSRQRCHEVTTAVRQLPGYDGELAGKR
jgi:hypothetical protein